MKCKQNNILTSQKRSGSADYLNNADSILLKNNSFTQSLTDEEKYNLLTHHFKPGGRYVFPKTKIHNKMRSFQRPWQSAYPWLVYIANQKMEVFANTVCCLRHITLPVFWLAQR